jgi:hypothetical protein
MIPKGLEGGVGKRYDSVGVRREREGRK